MFASRPRTLLLILLSLVLILHAAAQNPPKHKSKTSKEKVEATAKSRFPMVNADPVRTYPPDPDIDKAFFEGVPPASCSEWAVHSPPPVDPNAKCKELGGKSCCGRCDGPAYDMSPNPGAGKVGQAFTVHLRIRNLGVGDYVIYSFGKIDWGDNSQQDVIPLGANVDLTHTYNSPIGYTVRAMGGAQFKYQGNGSCSYECCVDNSITVNIAP